MRQLADLDRPWQNQGMSQEIERKFRLAQAPEEAVLGAGLKVEQGYILTGATELRVRRKGDRCYLAVKTTGTLVRDEWESEIPCWVLESLWAETANRRIEKTRYALLHEGITLEVDVYSGALAGLTILECEFETERAARDFKLPSWAQSAIEVTADARYKNKSLAVKGSPV